MNIKEALGLTGHSTEVAGLHPRLQANYEAALAVLASLGDDGMETIGCSSVAEVGDHLFAAYDRTGRKAVDLGYSIGHLPRIAYFGDRVDRFEVPSPIALSVASSTSRRASVVLILWNSVNDAGYGDLRTATGLVDGIYDDIDAANDRIAEIQRAITRLRVAVSEADRLRSEDDGGEDVRTGPAF